MQVCIILYARSMVISALSVAWLSIWKESCFNTWTISNQIKRLKRLAELKWPALGQIFMPVGPCLVDDRFFRFMNDKRSQKK